MLPDYCWLFRIVVEDEVSFKVVGDPAGDMQGDVEFAIGASWISARRAAALGCLREYSTFSARSCELKWTSSVNQILRQKP